MSRPFAAPPGGPAERTEVVRTAMHNDREYLEDAAKLGLEVSPIGGAEALQAIDRIAATPPTILDHLKRLMIGGKGQVKDAVPRRQSRHRGRLQINCTPPTGRESQAGDCNARPSPGAVFLNGTNGRCVGAG